MSILNMLNEQKREEFSDSTFNFAKAGIGIAGLAFAGNQILKAGQKDIIDGFTKTSRNKSDLGNKVDVLNKEIGRLRDASIEQLKFSIFEEDQINKILDGSIPAEERKAFLIGVFDNVKESSDPIQSQQLIDILEDMYYAEGNAFRQIEQSNKELVKNYFNTNIKQDNEKLNNFNKTYTRYKNVKNLLSDTKVEFKPLSKEPPFKAVPNNKFSGLNSNVKTRFAELKGQFKGSNVELVSIREGEGKQGMSYIARIQEGDNILNVTLQAGRDDKSGLKVYRGTQNLSSRYAVTSAFVDPQDFLSDLTFNKNKLISFEDYMYRQVRASGMSSVNKNMVNSFNEFQRAMGVDMPRTMIDSSGAIDQKLQNNLALSRRVQSSIYIPSAGMTRSQQDTIVQNLIRANPGVLGGPGNAQTQTMRVADPFDRSAQLSFNQIKLKGQGFDPLDYLASYGRKIDRTTQPQTAREAQYIGRYEMFTDESVVGFGKNKDILSYGTGDELIGLNKTAKDKIYGKNFAGFIITDSEKMTELKRILPNFAEGQALGSKQTVRQSFTKTIVDRNLGGFSLMEDIISRDNRTITVGGDGADYTIDDFFKKFGVKGEAILGDLDSDFASIKRHKGLKSFTLKLSEFSEDAGRKKYHLIGSKELEMESTKIFSSVHKGNLEVVEEGSINRALGRVFSSTQGAAGIQNFMQYTQGAEGSRVFSSLTETKKSVYNLTNQIMGGYSFIGGDSATLNNEFKSIIGKDSDFLNQINKINNTNYNNLDNVPAVLKQKTQVLTLVDLISKKATANNASDLGIVLGGVRSLSKTGAFGLEEKDIINAFGASKAHSGILNQTSDLGFTFGAYFGSSGDTYPDLGRNLAKIEPRYMNYAHASLVSNFGMTSDEATNYLSSMAVRQEGMAQRQQALFGMKLNAFSLAKNTDLNLLNKAMQASSLESLDDTATRKLLELSGDEKGIAQFLSQSDEGFRLSFDNLNLSSKARSELTNMFGGRSEVMLPGKQVFEGIIGHRIQGANASINIEGEYSRYINDLISSFASLEGVNEQDSNALRQALKGVQTSRENIFNVAGATLRNSLSGKVLGSGTYKGRGYNVGRDTKSLDGLEKIKAKKFREIYKKTKGHGLLMDAQSFMDGMTSFKEAARRDSLSRGMGGKAADAAAGDLLFDNLRNFFLGIHGSGKSLKGVAADAQRNPIVGMTNLMLGQEVFRRDFAYDGTNKDKFFEFFNPTKKRLAGDSLKSAATRLLYEEDTYEKAMGEILGEKNLRDSLTKSKAGNINPTDKEFDRFKSRLHGIGKKEDPIRHLNERISQLNKNKKLGSREEKLRKIRQLHMYRNLKNRLIEKTQDKYNQAKGVVLESDIFDETKEVMRYKGVSDKRMELLEQLSKDLGIQEQVRVETGSKKEGTLRVENRTRLVSSFEEISQRMESLSDTQKAKANSTLKELFEMMSRDFATKGDVGGGTVTFFETSVTGLELKDQKGKVVGTFDGRIDLNRAAVGDFDGDIYQVFFNTNKQQLGESGKGSMRKQALEWAVFSDQLSKGMKKMGARIGAGSMTSTEAEVSDYMKEKILKGVGGVDIEIKTTMLGLARSLSENKKASMSAGMMAGMSLLSAAQEVLVIQSKKLPVASDVPKELVNVIRQGFKEGNASALRGFLMENIFQDTALEKGKIDLTNLKFDTLDDELSGIMRDQYKGVSINLDEVFGALDEGMASVKKHGYDKISSNTRIGKALKQGSVADMNQLFSLLTSMKSLEGQVVDEGVYEDTIERIMNVGRESKAKAASSLKRIGGTVAIAAAAISMGIGMVSGPNHLEGNAAFSDSRVRESLSGRAMHTGSTDHASMAMAPTANPFSNFYERPINMQETSVVSNRNARMYGEAPTYNSMVQTGKNFIQAGGQANLTVNDTRMPISNSYITSSLRD